MGSNREEDNSFFIDFSLLSVIFHYFVIGFLFRMHKNWKPIETNGNVEFGSFIVFDWFVTNFIGLPFSSVIRPFASNEVFFCVRRSISILEMTGWFGCGYGVMESSMNYPTKQAKPANIHTVSIKWSNYNVNNEYHGECYK